MNIVNVVNIVNIFNVNILNVNTKDQRFLTDELNFSTFSPYDRVHNWRWPNMRVRACLAGVQSVYRVCIVHEIVGVGGLFE